MALFDTDVLIDNLLDRYGAEFLQRNNHGRNTFWNAL